MVSLSPHSPIIPAHDPLIVRLGKLESVIENIEKMVEQRLTSKITEMILTSKIRHFSSRLDDEINKNQSLNEKKKNLEKEVRNLKEDLIKEKEQSTNAQILTFKKIMRFFLEKILALFSIIFQPNKT